MNTTQKAAAAGASEESFTLTDNRTGESIEMPVLEGSEGPPVIDVRRLYAETGCFTYDPGYTSTGSCESKITFIDGDKGILLYRGYPIEELAEHAEYMEVCYLLLYGGTARPGPKGQVRKKHH